MTKKKAKKVPTKPSVSAAVSKGMKSYWARKRVAEVLAVKEPVKTVSAVIGLDAEGIKRIIECCAAKGVLSFQYGDLQLVFNKSLDEPRTEVSQRTGRGDTLSNLEGASRVEDRQHLQETSDMVTEELEHLKVTDPAAYEEFIQSEDADDGDGYQ